MLTRDLFVFAVAMLPNLYCRACWMTTVIHLKTLETAATANAARALSMMGFPRHLTRHLLTCTKLLLLLLVAMTTDSQSVNGVYNCAVHNIFLMLATE